MSIEIRFLGVAGFEVVGPRHRFLIDPFLSDNPYAPCRPEEIERPDLILVSHAARDHYGDAAVIARLTGAPVLGDSAVRAMMIDQGLPATQVRATTWGITTEIAGMTVRALECHHWSVGTLSDGRPVFSNAIAFLVELEPHIRLYHYGDTSIFDMSLIGRLNHPTIGLLGCTTPTELQSQASGPGRSLTGEMNALEAATAAEMLGLKLSVACHYLRPDKEVARFVELVKASGSEAIAPTVGDTISIVGHEAGRIEATIRPAVRS